MRSGFVAQNLIEVQRGLLTLSWIRQQRAISCCLSRILSNRLAQGKRRKGNSKKFRPYEQKPAIARFCCIAPPEGSRNLRSNHFNPVAGKDDRNLAELDPVKGYK
jgi:hypothetical protein